MAIVAQGHRGRVYLEPNDKHAEIAGKAQPEWKPENELVGKCRDQLPLYGMNSFADVFSARQLTALTVLSELVGEAIGLAHSDALTTGFQGENAPLQNSGGGPLAYAQAVGVYLAFVVDKCADYWSEVCSWHTSGEKIRNTFGRQAIPMTWSFAEANPFSSSTGSWSAMAEWVRKCVDQMPATHAGTAVQANATKQTLSSCKIISTDPPYYDNIGYADLSDFFYVWLRKTLRAVFPDLFSTLAAPKDQELVATRHRHKSKLAAEDFFLSGMTMAVGRLSEQAHVGVPVTIYYAFKQSESKGGNDSVSTGWETFLAALVETGYSITGTWPVRTELNNRMVGMGANALASSIVLVCRHRSESASIATRRQLISILRAELPRALRILQSGNIAPVDLAQAAIGPGMEVYTRYAKSRGWLWRLWWHHGSGCPS